MSKALAGEVVGHTMDSGDRPVVRQRVLTFSPRYPEESDMRFRILDSEFLNICNDVVAWATLEEPDIY